jgi:hypothetical protein
LKGSGRESYTTLLKPWWGWGEDGVTPGPEGPWPGATREVNGKEEGCGVLAKRVAYDAGSSRQRSCRDGAWSRQQGQHGTVLRLRVSAFKASSLLGLPVPPLIGRVVSGGVEHESPLCTQ